MEEGNVLILKIKIKFLVIHVEKFPNVGQYLDNYWS